MMQLKVSSEFIKYYSVPHSYLPLTYLTVFHCCWLTENMETKVKTGIYWLKMLPTGGGGLAKYFKYCLLERIISFED